MGKYRKFIVKLICLEAEIRTGDLQVTKQSSVQPTPLSVTSSEVLHSHGPVLKDVNFVFTFDMMTLVSTERLG